VLYWPGGGAIVGSLDMVQHMPADMVEALGVPWVSTDPEKGDIRAEARTSRLGFIDDVRIQTRPLSGGGSRVDVRSASRVGIYDFGMNARRIRAYLERLALRATPAG